MNLGDLNTDTFGRLHATCWSSDNKKLCMCYEDGYTIWDIAVNKLVEVVEFSNAEINKFPIYHEGLGFLLLLIRKDRIRLWSVDRKQECWRYYFEDLNPVYGKWSCSVQYIAIKDDKAKMAILEVDVHVPKVIFTKDLQDPIDDDLEGTEVQFSSWSPDSNYLIMTVGNFLQKTLFSFNLQDRSLNHIL